MKHCDFVVLLICGSSTQCKYEENNCIGSRIYYNDQTNCIGYVYTNNNLFVSVSTTIKYLSGIETGMFNTINNAIGK